MHTYTILCVYVYGCLRFQWCSSSYAPLPIWSATSSLYEHINFHSERISQQSVAWLSTWDYYVFGHVYTYTVQPRADRLPLKLRKSLQHQKRLKQPKTANNAKNTKGRRARACYSNTSRLVFVYGAWAKTKLSSSFLCSYKCEFRMPSPFTCTYCMCLCGHILSVLVKVTVVCVCVHYIRQ